MSGTAHARRSGPPSSVLTADVSRPKRKADNNSARLRPRELSKLLWKRWRGRIPPDDEGKRAIRATLDCLAKLGPDADRRMENFLQLNVSWMSASDRAAAKEAAFAANIFWSAEHLGRELGLTFAERCALGITTFRPVDVSFEELVDIQRKKHAERQRMMRLQKRLQTAKVPAPVRRADAIDRLLPSGEWFDVTAICLELQRIKALAFASLCDEALRVAAHRAIKHGVDAGLFQTRTVPGPKFPSMQIAKRGARR
jgi:hypothetical protein